LRRPDGDFAPVAGLTRDRFDFDDALEDLRHLQLEEPAQEVLVRPRMTTCGPSAAL
jgi:hypothetical protein